MGYDSPSPTSIDEKHPNSSSGSPSPTNIFTLTPYPSPVIMSVPAALTFFPPTNSPSSSLNLCKDLCHMHTAASLHLCKCPLLGDVLSELKRKLLMSLSTFPCLFFNSFYHYLWNSYLLTHGCLLYLEWKPRKDKESYLSALLYRTMPEVQSALS